ncbi:Nucleoprotein [Frankliniella fusca]|uniref:Nucleoprotein n=1 Tax=Frankliniella fusca TaxID=407009 RepID=A0AAE1LD02_9NEOP|nr:Nucleoprotein [Frankliniella fusca]
MQVALAAAAPSTNDNGKWTQRPDSPTERRSFKTADKQQVDHTNDKFGTHTSGYLALGDNARQSSPQRTGQPSTGGEASTSKGKSKGKGK